MTVLAILATPNFVKVVKKLHTKDKAAVDNAVKAIAKDPTIGDEKKGDLVGTFVYKFKLNMPETLLSYQLQPSKSHATAILLLSLGSHENFYAELKRLG